MNFFEHQDAAKKKTSLLILLLMAAVASLIFITVLALASILFFTGNHATSIHVIDAYNTSFLDHLGIIFTSEITLYIALGVIFVVGGASLFKLAQVSKGGAMVATSLGGRMVQPDSKEPNERKVLNVVEEMAIASGNPVPMVFVIEEDGINAFAAGNGRRDAVIGITRGTINLLSRDEIQGVVAHEFSHIHNGDMRLNMRIIAILHGILVIGLIGDMIWRSTYYRVGYGISHRRNSKNSGATISLAIALTAIGYAGTFFGSIIKAAVSRQREFLADASAVQFTRNPEGIGGALKKIGGHGQKSYIQHSTSGQFSHMFFGSSVKTSFMNMFATHPPLADRIKRIQPGWDGKFLTPSTERPLGSSYVEPSAAPHSPEHKASVMAAVIGAATQAPSNPSGPLPDIEFTLESATELNEPTAKDLDNARQFIEGLPKPIHDASHEPFSARALIYCILLDKDPSERNNQLTFLKAHAASETFREVAKIRPLLSKLPAHAALAIVDLSIPALKQQSAPQLERFLKNLAGLIKADGKITLFEWCIYRIVGHNLREQNPKENTSLRSTITQLKYLLEVVACEGGSAAPQQAFEKGWGVTGLPAQTPFAHQPFSAKKMENSIRALAKLKPLDKPKVLKGMAEIILADGEVTAVEAELYRAIADLLNCPVAPLSKL